jgi:outer membrane protein assembly factor BamA
VFGRFVFRALWDVRDHDTQKTLVSLGGDSGLRGYPAQWFNEFGASKLLINLEYRTRPWVISSVHVGAVLFYDAGTVYQHLAEFDLHQGVGVGLRILFPQFNRYAFRIDMGTPVIAPGGYAVQFSYGSDQVVPLTQAEDDLAASRLSLAP